MNPPSHKLTVRAGTALGVLAMAAIGWKVADQPEKQAAAAPLEQAAHATKRPPRIARKSGPPEAVRQRMASIRAIASPEDRMRATIELANKLPVSEIAAWMEGRWFNTGAGFDLTLFNKILTERWRNEDPEGLLVWQMKSHSNAISETLATWAETDPQRVMDFFENHLDSDQQLRALAVIAVKSPAFALQCLREMPGGKPSDGFYKRQVLEALAKSSPTELEAALAGLPLSLKNQAESILIGQRLQTSFESEFSKLLERPDGMTILSEHLLNVKGLRDKVFDQLANLPQEWKNSIASNPFSFIEPSNAMKWWNADLESMGFSETSTNRIRKTALAMYASKYPEEAIKLMDSEGLDASYRKNVIANIFNNLGKDREKAESLIALLGSEEEKREARGRLPIVSEEQPGQKFENPSELLQKMSAIDPESGNSTYQFFNSLREWNPEKMAELGEQFRSLPDDKKTPIARMFARNSDYSGNLSPALVGDAIRYLVGQPANPEGRTSSQSIDPVAQASQLAVNWSKKDPEAASQWVQSLPAGEAKLWAQKNLAANWCQYDPEAVDQWIKTLPANSRGEVEKFIKHDSKAEEPEPEG